MCPSQSDNGNLVQRVILLAEVRQVVHLGRGDEPSVKVVSPGVIGAADHVREGSLGRLAEPRATMAADVVKGADRIVVGPGDDHALAGHVAKT